VSVSGSSGDPRDVDDFFGDLRDFPGKREPALRNQKPVPVVKAPWDDKPRMYMVNGVKTEFFTIGHVALAMNREARTIRMWERKAWIPPATFRTATPKRSKIKEAGDRLWSRSQVETMVRIAQEEGVLDGKPPSRAFTAKLVKAFLALQQHGNS
jgi:hypothetical protein